MVKKISFIFTLCVLMNFFMVLMNSVHASLDLKTSGSESYNNFEDNFHVSKKMKKIIRPYLIPKDHPAKAVLDQLFHSRVTLNESTFINAGFTILFAGPRSFIRVASHPLLPEYLVKMQYDNELRLKKGKPLWYWFAKRCEGAKKIRRLIKSENIQHFTVAKKWIYPLLASSEAPLNSSYIPKPVVLLVQDMHLVSEEENLAAWKNVMTTEYLDELFLIITCAGGNSYRPDNIVLTEDRKTFAFIDTEYPNAKPNLKVLENYLSPEMQVYWNYLIRVNTVL